MMIGRPRRARQVTGKVAGEQDGDDLSAAIAEVLMTARQPREQAVNGALAVAFALDRGASRNPFPSM